jgi:IPT/TIG domain
MIKVTFNAVRRGCAVVLFASGAAGCQSQYLDPGSNPISPSGSPTPAITSISPASGRVGSQVTIAGISFGSTQGSSAVTFGGVGAPVASWTVNSITATVPAGAASGNVVVNAGGLPSNAVPFTVTP